MIKSIKNLFEQYNTYSKGERVAILLLIFLIIVVIAFPLFLNRINNNDKTDFSEFKSYLNDSSNFYNKNTDGEEKLSLENENKNFHYNSYDSKFKPFDPNNITSDQMISMGFRPYLAERIVKYRNAGGKFLKKEDLLKIYGFSEVFYKQLEPYIAISHQNELNSTISNNIKKEETSRVNSNQNKKFKINEMDSNDLKSIYGIGSKLALRIISYRNKLGGFYSNEQLSEVYGLSPETLSNLNLKIEASTGDYKKLNINIASETELSNHPYFKKNTAKLIINYRLQHGNYNTIEDLKKIKVIDDVTINKIAPYLIF